MRIQDRTSLGPAAPETGRSAETQKTGREGVGQNSPAAAQDGDRIELSTALGSLSQAVMSYSTQRANRVQALSTDYQAGQFHPDPQATSQAMVTEALAQG